MDASNSDSEACRLNRACSRITLRHGAWWAGDLESSLAAASSDHRHRIIRPSGATVSYLSLAVRLAGCTADSEEQRPAIIQVSHGHGGCRLGSRRMRVGSCAVGLPISNRRAGLEVLVLSERDVSCRGMNRATKRRAKKLRKRR